MFSYVNTNTVLHMRRSWQNETTLPEHDYAWDTKAVFMVALHLIKQNCDLFITVIQERHQQYGSLWSHSSYNFFLLEI